MLTECPTRIDTDARNRDFERIFVGNYQRSVTHFYSVGFDRAAVVGPLDREPFAFGYFTPDDVFHHGLVYWDAHTGTFERSPTASR